jgi:hypothetical protein
MFEILIMLMYILAFIDLELRATAIGWYVLAHDGENKEEPMNGIAGRADISYIHTSIMHTSK